MSLSPCPVTGVQLNEVSIERASLNYREAVTASVLKLQGQKYQTIAAMLGTNTHRLGEVFRGEKHDGAEFEARKLLGLA